MDRILIPGLRELGIHGLLPEERVRPQPFEVNVELHVDLTKAGASDDLADTVDYSAVCDCVRKVVSSESYQLLERLAERIADVCRTDPRVVGVVIEVRKLEPPVAAQVDHVAVRIER